MKNIKLTMNPIHIKLIAGSALFFGENAVFAHQGHGATGAHWHTLDGLGFIVSGALVASALWLSRSGR